MAAVSRLTRNAGAVESRLAAARTALGLPTDPSGDIITTLRATLLDPRSSVDARAAAAVLAATGRYPTTGELDTLAGWLATGDDDEAWGFLMRLTAASDRRALRREPDPAPELVVDLTRTSRATEVTGIPRVAIGLAREAQVHGAAMVVWESGAPGRAYVDEASGVRLAPGSWSQSRVMHRVLRGLKRVYWGTIAWLSRWPTGYGMARSLRAATAPLGDAMFGRASPSTVVVLGAGQYVCPEVNRADAVDRLLAWRRAQPGLRVTVVLHDLLPLVTPQFFAPDQRVEHIEFARLVAAADRVVVASRHLLREVEGLVLLHDTERPPRIRVVPYGVGTAACTARSIPPLSVPEFVMVGSMELRKNHILALRALGALARRGRRTTLHVVGHARPVHPETQEALAYARSHGVVVLEHRGLDDDGMVGLMANARASLYLSWAEGFGLPVLESLACGLPVFASDTAANREHLRYGGIVLVPPNRPDLLCDHLDEYLADPGIETALRQSIRRSDLPLGYTGWADAVLDMADLDGTAPHAGATDPPSAR